LAYYDIRNPLAVALCQGAALHYCDGTNGVKDFDVWFFYPFRVKHLPYRHIWRWNYENAKFGRNPNDPAFSGRRVDVLVRSIKSNVEHDPASTIRRYLKDERTATSKALAAKAVVLLAPEASIGQIVWRNET